MSTLSVHDIQGISAYGNEIRIPTGSSLNVVGGAAVGTLKTNNLQKSNGTAWSFGKVLQYVDYRYPSTNDNYTAIGSNTDYDTPVTISITPKSTTSKLVVHSIAHTRFIAAYGMSGGLKRDGVKISGNQNVGGLYFFYKGDQVNHHHNVECTASVTSGSLNTTTFTVWVRPYEGTGEWTVGWGNNYIQVWEVEV